MSGEEDNVEALHAKLERLKRLAQTVADDGIRQEIKKMIAELEERAAVLLQPTSKRTKG